MSTDTFEPQGEAKVIDQSLSDSSFSSLVPVTAKKSPGEGTAAGVNPMKSQYLAVASLFHGSAYSIARVAVSPYEIVIDEQDLAALNESGANVIELLDPTLSYVKYLPVIAYVGTMIGVIMKINTQIKTAKKNDNGEKPL